MKTYRINCVDDGDHIVSTFDRLCIDDLDALDRANELCATNGVEVWDGARRVVWMHKGGAARLTTSNRAERANSSPIASSVAAFVRTTCSDF